LEAGGWLVLLERFQSDHIAGMHKYPTRFMILLIDLDGKLDRIGDVARQIPAELAARVFILSTLTEPEDLRASAGSYEEIGKAMARDCREQADNIWKHQLLRHNTEELVRLRESIRPFTVPVNADLTPPLSLASFSTEATKVKRDEPKGPTTSNCSDFNRS
jgi:hypothetical protein